MTVSQNLLNERPVVPTHALIGILAVSLSAVISTLGAGLIGVGLEDLRGVWGIGIDDAAYVTTIFNASQMFMGPISIVLAARFGHRKVLLYAGLVYVLISLLLPLAPTCSTNIRASYSWWTFFRYFLSTLS